MFEKEMRLGIKLALKAGKLACNGKFKTHDKGKFDIVTDKDLEVEKFIIEQIKKKFPKDNIVSEETNYEKKISSRSWVIDPIDGTINFAKGLPEWGVQLAFVDHEETQFSVIYLPKFNLLFTAKNGDGAYCNFKQININPNVDLKDVVISTGDIKPSAAHKKAFNDCLNSIENKILISRKHGSACFALSMVANSCLGACFAPIHTPWDYLPGELIVKESGGHVIHETYKTVEYSIAAANENIAKFIQTEFKKAL